MSTLSPSPNTESVDSITKNTLALVAICGAIFCGADALRGIPFTKELAMFNFMGAFFIAIPLMLIIAARNVARWTPSEYLGLIALTLVAVVPVGMPILAQAAGVMPVIDASQTDVSDLALRRFESFSQISGALALVTLIAFAFYGTRAKVWTAFQRQPMF
jgi:hypothetical protein